MNPNPNNNLENNEDLFDETFEEIQQDVRDEQERMDYYELLKDKATFISRNTRIDDVNESDLLLD